MRDVTLQFKWLFLSILTVFYNYFFFPIDGGAPLVTKELVSRLMSEIGLLGFCSYSVAVEQRVDIVAVITIPCPWLVLVIRAAFCHCAKLKKRKMADSHMRKAANRLCCCLQCFGF